MLSIFDAQGRLVATNAGWADAPEISVANAHAGAFPFEQGSKDAALVLNLFPGAYTAHITGAAGTTGIALAEVYELSSDFNHFINISTRARVGTGPEILIGGFIASGSLPTKVLVRAVGPGLVASGLSDLLINPILTIYNSSGQLVAINQGWTQGSTGAVVLAAAMASAGAFALEPGSLDCAVVLALPPGGYTAHVSGTDGSVGTALFEVYQLRE